jgi:BMFP domain-containing protein YqiC
MTGEFWERVNEMAAARGCRPGEVMREAVHRFPKLHQSWLASLGRPAEGKGEVETTTVSELKTENEALKQRLATLEQRLAGPAEPTTPKA